MRRSDLTLIILGAALLLLIAGFGVRVAEHYPAARAELARVKLMQVEDDVRERIRAMQHDALITYFVSPREQMPSSLRRIERDVADVLEAMKNASNGRIDYQIVRPDQAIEHAERDARRLAPRVLRHLTNTNDEGDSEARDRIVDLLAPVLLRTGVSQREAGDRSRTLASWLLREHAARIEAEDELTADLLSEMIQNGIIDAGNSVVEHAVHQRVSPFRVRTVTRDSYTQRTVWSTLHIAYGPHTPAVVNGVSPEHLPRLQSLIMGQVEQKDTPRTPVIGIAAAGEHYSQFRWWISREARVIDVDLSQPIPDEVDVLFWFDPADVPPTLIRRLNEFLADGRSIVIAGSRHDMRQIDGWEFEFTRTRYDADALLSAFGLRPLDGLVLDTHSLTMPGEVAPMPAMFMIRCIAHNQDFRAMRNHPNGHLFFTVPTPFGLDGDALAQRGFTPTILATTSDRTTVRDMTYGRVRLDRAEVQPGDAAPKLPLMVWLRPDKPWQGSVVFSASSHGFRNEWFVHENFAHRRLADILVETLASDERLVIHQAGIDRPQPLPEMTAGQRFMWRAICILLIPALLGVVAWRRGVFRNTTDSPRVKQSTAAMLKSGLPLRAAAGLALVVIFASVAMAIGTRADLTRDKLNQLAPETRAIASQSRDEHAVTVNLYYSRSENLPPNMRPMLRRLRSMLNEFRRAGADLSINTHFPDDLNADDRDALDAKGIKPIRSISRDEEVTTVRNIYSTVELTSVRGGRELLHFPDRLSFENLEFRLAFALRRLQTGRTPHIAFIADIPRLSAAEVYHDFQQQNLFAPTGADVHAHARALLEQAGFRVTHVNPRQPSLPEGEIDLILWMQPRRDILPLLQASVERLHQGTPMVVAAQHFVMQSRQFRGDQFRMVYWPQPQVADVQRFYFPEIGATLVHEVLFDDRRSAMAIETQVRQATDQRDYGAQVAALPFLIRAIARNFDPTHPITRGLGDQVMPFANHFALDNDRLSSFGLSARTLITTSDRSWTFDWEGGWLPDVLLDDLPRAEVLPQRAFLHGRLPLAVLIEGRFPLPAEPLTMREIHDQREMKFIEDVGEPSRLLLIGNSYMFRNDRLFEPDFRADHLLLNAAAYLALDESLARIAGHRYAAPGLDYIEPEERLMWRGVVLGAGPVLLLLFGVMWWVARSMPSRMALKLREHSREAASG